jgi:hypothetical protein
MLGPPKLHRLEQSITVSLEELVPAGNFYRHLDAKLDLSFVRDRSRLHCPRASSGHRTRRAMRSVAPIL